MQCPKCGSQMRFRKADTHELDRDAGHTVAHSGIRHPAHAVIAGAIWLAGKAMSTAGVGGRYSCLNCGHSQAN